MLVSKFIKERFRSEQHREDWSFKKHLFQALLLLFVPKLFASCGFCSAYVYLILKSSDIIYCIAWWKQQIRIIIGILCGCGKDSVNTTWETFSINFLKALALETSLSKHFISLANRMRRINYSSPTFGLNW